METANARLQLKHRDYFRKGRHLEVRRQTTVQFPLHGHTYFELEILLHGDAVQSIAETSYTIGRGSVYVLTPTDVHKVVPNEGELVLWNIVFDEAMLSEERYRALLLGRLRTPQRLSEEELHSVDRLTELLFEQVNGDGLYERELFDCLLSMLERSRPSDAPVACETPHAIERALLYLQAHFREPIKLSTLARTVGFHPSYFSEKFKAVTGEGFVEHLNRLRITYAKALLAQGVSVTESAMRAGYASLSHFQHTFRRLVGSSPSAYRTLT